MTCNGIRILGCKRDKSASVFHAFMLLVICWTLAFSLACRIAPVAPADRGDFLFANLIGSTRLAFGQQFIVEADRWFHRGVGHFRETAFSSWFTRKLDSVRPRHHVHLEDEEVGEMMPWLFFAARMDPANIEAYAVAAFFMDSWLGRPDLAEKAMMEAQRRNPGDYRIFYERGRFALRHGKLEEAGRFFSAAGRLWPGVLDPADDDARHDRAAILVYSGLLREMEGRVEEAIELYEDVLTMFPARRGLHERVIELKTTGRAKAEPEDIWKMMLSHHPFVCEHGEHEHH